MSPEQITARLEALDAEDDGWAGTLLVEPLTALAGGLLGGALVGALAWRLAWQRHRPPLHLRLRPYYRR